VSDLAFLTVAEGARRIAAGALSPVDWTEALLERIDRIDPQVNAYITVAADAARAAAREAHDELARGQRRGWLHGVPFALKDVIETAGVRTTAHSRLYEAHVPARDATVAARLLEAGGVLIGKHAQYELSYGGPSFDLPWPPARNPWNLERIPGGSSSGTAAAIAAGLCPAGIGTDAGGSIRQPASFCGVAGLKPSANLVPRDGIIPMTFSLGAAGPMAWTAEDCALLLDTVARTTTTATIEAGAKGLRIGVLRGFLAPPMLVADAARAAFEAALATLSGLGVRLMDAGGPDVFDLDACGRVILLAEAYANHEAQLRRDPSVFGRIARHRFALGAFLSAADYLQATRQRRRLMLGMDALFDDFDALVAPAEASGAPTFEAASASFPFTQLPSLRIAFNVTGHPALSVCCGFDADGMPLGLQIIAPRGRDDLVLTIGHAYERATPWRARRPAV
jgi:aspartyl-tRNA(Asn)/glutamyl-tRNA(Gln) amidotransferase subunit A